MTNDELKPAIPNENQQRAESSNNKTKQFLMDTPHPTNNLILHRHSSLSQELLRQSIILGQATQ